MIPGIPCAVCSQPGHKPSKCPELLPSSGEVNKEDAKYGQAGDDEEEGASQYWSKESRHILE